MILASKAALQIQQPAEIVFEAIVNPAQMSRYFISESSGRMDSEEEVHWKFPEFPDRYPVKIIEIERNRSLSFVWDPETTVTITLDPQQDQSTVVRVVETGKELSEQNLEWALQNTAGWANFLACMKAYLEYGIQLRKGAFDFMRKS